MTAEPTTQLESELRVENIGGIDRTSITFSPGVTILVGRNATNRTSLLQALKTVLGSDDATIKGDAEEGTVELDLGDQTYRRRLMRRSGTVVFEGDPYMDDPELADLFAFLLESNEARRAVARGDDLRDLIMRPLDTDAIQDEIQRRLQERQEIEDQLEEIEDLKQQLPQLEAKRRDLTDQVEAKKQDLEETEAELEEADRDIEQTQEEQSELEAKLAELRQKRAELDDVRYDLETEQESLEQLQRERRDLKTERDELPDVSPEEIDEVEEQLADLREQKRTAETRVNELQTVIGFNEELLDEVTETAFADLASDSGTSDAVTDQLLEDQQIRCWTCGSGVTMEEIETTLDELRRLSQEKVGVISDLEAEIDDVEERRQELEQARSRRKDIDRRVADLDDEIETTEDRIDTLRSRRDALTDEIEEIEAAVEELEDDEYSAVLDLHKKANQLEYELGQTEAELERVEENIATIESQLDRESELEQRRENVQAQIEELRTKIERIEEDAVTHFNEHMDTVLGLLEYDNLERVWLERVEQEVRDGRQKKRKSVFELHVVRSTASGTTYEDTVDHLSESEREVTGLVFALAGYLAHELYEQLPFMLLDSLEAIDSDRIAALVEYFEAYTEYLIVALLPEDATALDEEYDRLTQI